MQERSDWKKEQKHIARLRKRIADNPHDHFALYELVQSLWTNNQHQEALELCKKLVHLDDISPSILEAAAKFFFENAILEEALFC
ncbi:MAG: hypothetical protein HY770_03490, partial [Chitinivibrionia bacterium]|nr:hypothetical protein [Chitinivibrionia bacterium]